MKIRKCNLCSMLIGEDDNDSVSFGAYDFCGICTCMIRLAVCLRCHGKGKCRMVDDEATSIQATCGESRTQYKFVPCTWCNRFGKK